MLWCPGATHQTFIVLSLRGPLDGCVLIISTTQRKLCHSAVGAATGCRILSHNVLASVRHVDWPRFTTSTDASVPFWAELCILWYKYYILHTLSMISPIRSYFKTGPQPDLACGGGSSHFQNGWHEFSMSHILANNIDTKLIIVSMSMFSGSRNPNVAIILVCGGCGSHFQNGRHEFSMSHISADNIDRKFIFVSLCLLSRSQNKHMVNLLVRGVCGSHFQNGRHEFPMSHISANNIDSKLILVSMSMFSESRNQNVAIILVCWGCGSHFQNGRHECSMFHISANNIDRKYFFVYLSLMSGP